ncbi:hypothetical protein WMY93_004390 [Mugilogobius chulae]|uniref:Fatty acid hydroxylase domain-containing protein n=1 Tax=Mugilogobius chulae TaxID=88201 RepID=A0AAW0PQY7_9GOBI
MLLRIISSVLLKSPRFPRASVTSRGGTPYLMTGFNEHERSSRGWLSQIRVGLSAQIQTRKALHHLHCRTFCSESEACSASPGLWDSVRADQEEILKSPYLPACFAFLTHVVFCVPFFFMDMLSYVCPQIRSRRIAPDSAQVPAPSPRLWMECLGRLTLRYVTVVLPAVVMLQCILKSPVLPERAPSWYCLCGEVLACLLLFDTFFFAYHVSVHKFSWLYRNVHQEHHQQNRALFALAAQDGSSVELLSLLLLALMCTWLVGCHPLSEATFHLLNTWLAVEDHCGYDLPMGLHRFFSKWGLGGALFHQTHHTKPNWNYAPYFTHWDLLFGTYRE